MKAYEVHRDFERPTLVFADTPADAVDRFARRFLESPSRRVLFQSDPRRTTGYVLCSTHDPSREYRVTVKQMW